MKFTSLSVLGIFLCASIISTARAQDTQDPEMQTRKSSVSFGFQHYSDDVDKCNCLLLRGDYGFTEHVSTEVDVFRSISCSGPLVSGDIYVLGLGGFVKYEIPFSNDSSSVYIRAGFSQLRLSFDVDDSSGSDTDTGTAYGLGFAMNVANTSRIRFDWTKYNFDEFTNADAFAISWMRKF